MPEPMSEKQLRVWRGICRNYEYAFQRTTGVPGHKDYTAHCTKCGANLLEGDPPERHTPNCPLRRFMEQVEPQFRNDWAEAGVRSRAKVPPRDQEETDDV